MRIRHIFISPGHNYFGHHGMPAGEHPIVEVAQVECVPGMGLVGDRFFGHKPDYKGQVTFFAWEDLLALWDALDVEPRDPSATRRNVITEGADLKALVGQEFEIQGVPFLGTEECRPCKWMEGAIKPGAEAWMHGRGGLRARILGPGILKVDATP